MGADKIDMLMEIITDFRQETNVNFKTMNGRVRDLEVWKYRIVGGVAVVAAIVMWFK